MTRGVFLDRASVDTGDLDFSRLHATLEQWAWYDSTSPMEVSTHIADAKVVITNKVALSADVLKAAHSLKLICVAATGTNNIDLLTARACGIGVCNVRSYATPSVVQHVFSLMLALSTRLLDYHNTVRLGHWHKSSQFCLLDYPIVELAGKTLGIVGYGELGRAVAHVAEAFGMRVIVARGALTQNDQSRVSLDELLQVSDVISLHCPLTAETRGLIGAKELARMRSNAILINTARGGIVDELALANALREGQIGGAGMDVLSSEPPDASQPLLQPGIPNLIVTPHCAWASQASRQRLLNEIAENIEVFFAGNERNRVG